MTEQERLKGFTDWMQRGEQLFGATVSISQTITPMPNGGFAYTPPVLVVGVIKDWQPPAPQEDKDS